MKPKSPTKNSLGILTHDNVPACPNGKSVSPRTTPAPTTTSTTNGIKNVSNSNSANMGTNGVKVNRNISWNRDIPPEKLSFTMRREFDKAKEESDLIDQLRTVSLGFILFLFWFLYVVCCMCFVSDN